MYMSCTCTCIYIFYVLHSFLLTSVDVPTAGQVSIARTKTSLFDVSCVFNQNARSCCGCLYSSGRQKVSTCTWLQYDGLDFLCCHGRLESDCHRSGGHQCSSLSIALRCLSLRMSQVAMTSLCHTYLLWRCVQLLFSIWDFKLSLAIICTKPGI